MKQITFTTHYWFFKLVYPDSDIYCIRYKAEKPYSAYNEAKWFLGRENSIGGISPVGGDLSEETQELLEMEFQEKIKTDNLDFKNF